MPMNGDASRYTENTIPQDLVSRVDFASKCIRTRMSYTHVHQSRIIVVLTLGASAFLGAVKVIGVVARMAAVEKKMVMPQEGEFTT